MDAQPPIVNQEIADWLASEDGAIFAQDIDVWAKWYKRTEVSAIERFCGLFMWFSEFRTLFDYRVGTSKTGKKLKKHLEMHYKRANDLYINCPSIGPRFRIQHGHSTWVFARSIGSDFWVSQNVTIGSSGRGVPTIGNSVVVSTGAVVVGPITLGNHIHIAANAVVSQDVPSKSRVFPARSVIVPMRN